MIYIASLSGGDPTRYSPGGGHWETNVTLVSLLNAKIKASSICLKGE